MKQKSLFFTNCFRYSLISALILIVSGLYAQSNDFINFSARYDKQNVSLKWSTEQEQVFSHFVIEKSINGIDFKETAIVFSNDNAAPSEQYSYNDDLDSDTKPLLYYRLKMVNENQKSQRSAIRIIKTGDKLADVNMQVYPNPVVNELRITVPGTWQNKQVRYELYSVGGKMLKHFVTNHANQTEVFPMRELNRGVYFMKVTSGNETTVKQIMKGSSSNTH